MCRCEERHQIFKVDSNLCPQGTLFTAASQTKNTPPPASTHAHMHTPPPESSPAQVRSSGIMGNHSCGPSHLFHLRASQKHPRHRALCSPSLPLSSHTFSSQPFCFFPSSGTTGATEETAMVLLVVMEGIFSFTVVHECLDYLSLYQNKTIMLYRLLSTALLRTETIK